MRPLPSRQVHLDFHTSECIGDVGARFRKAAFQRALRLGRLNSITVFARCHHGWCYYPTKVGRMHPTLAFDLTGAMIEAAHEIGVRAPLYITVGWSAADAADHPDWLARGRDGQPVLSQGDLDAPPDVRRPYTSWLFLCPGTGYAEHVQALTREVCRRYAVDGIFFDINFRPVCFCPSCLEGMRREGLNPDDPADAETYNTRKWRRFAEACRAALHERHPEATCFFNGGANVFRPQFHDCHTHFELEDLPTTWGGYDRFPPRAKYFARTGKPYLAMSGKFHTSWGEFGGFKRREALRYEAAAMVAFGARCSFGDQMHPSGKMDPATYRLIGHAYRYIERIEKWCFDAEETTRLGVFVPTDEKSFQGAAEALMEKQLDFDIALPGDDLSRYDAVILPDAVTLDEDLAERLNAFAEGGGGILATGRSGLDAGRKVFLLNVGASYTGPARRENDYVRVGSPLGKGLVRSPVLCYLPAERVAPTDAEMLAAVHEPYFNRTYAHYCSHRNTPPRPRRAKHPAALRRGTVVYLAHPVFRMYHEFGAPLHRDYAINALRLVYRRPVLEVEMPSAGRARLVRLPAEECYVLHLLYAPPLRRGVASVIEDLPPLRRVKVRVRLREPIRRAMLQPQGRALPFRQQGEEVSLTVPKVQGHQMVVLEI